MKRLWNWLREFTGSAEMECRETHAAHHTHLAAELNGDRAVKCSKCERMFWLRPGTPC